MIDDLLPATVSCADTTVDDVPADALFPEEASLLRTSVPKRRREFTSVRVCARLAMADLGLPPVPVLPGPRGEPGWPEGIVGSMTHCAGYRAAAVARSSDVRALGIDAEPHAPLPENVLESIALPSEHRRVLDAAERGGGTGPIHWDRLLFSAKESVYKAWYPLMRTRLDFEDADIEFDWTPGPTTSGVFHARLLRTAPGAPTAFDGRWLVRDRLALTAVIVTAAA
ncbi:4'-phosphopantetheinyl transferase [uncultured Streptomyces sp.]|uniref:4'-phosphopantetheinyl transferase family protein n=1 Tax=uncultured Streptomyces sp. TaxID=174707 RepID=UPI0026276F88|nr:4'-phosphopantetheinyl transferase superfamily protein [uncultured Streptomyces sp.]